MVWLSDQLRLALTALLPAGCTLCGAASPTGPVCPECDGDLPLPVAPCCPQCAEATSDHTLCPDCQAESPAFDATVAAWPYAFPIDQLIQELKFRRQLALGPWFAERLLALIGHGNHLIDAVVPMPLHRHRLANRGFNQSYEIARPLARQLDRPLLADACRRVRETAHQTSLDRSERQQNLAQAFTCSEAVRDRSILLVDDVMTTGASAHAVALALRRAGATRVLVAVVARAHRRPEDTPSPAARRTG